MQPPSRFSDIPSTLDIQVSGGDAEEAVEISLEELLDDPTELCTLLENENVERRTWMTIALAYARQHKVDLAIDILQRALQSLSQGRANEKLAPLSLLCWLYLRKSRAAPRLLSEIASTTQTKTKDQWLQAATSTLNDAGRIDPAFPPLFLARGVLQLLRSSLQAPTNPSGSGAADHSERTASLHMAQKFFEDASQASNGRNAMAILGWARTSYSLGNYAEALMLYQKVLASMPDQFDPDPRIGIGCCLWQLGHKEGSQAAWERALEVNPDSKVAIILLGLFYLNESYGHSSKDAAFAPLYKKAMTDYTQRAFKLDKELPLTCATFAGYFALRRAWSTVETLARKAIEATEVNAIASDGWYLLARKEHSQDAPDYSKINDYYGRADAARGGGDRGYIPARFGIAQALASQGDLDGAKFRLDKIVHSSRSLEAMLLLGVLYAEDVFQSQVQGERDSKAIESKKAIALLEAVRLAWKDPQHRLSPDVSVLVYLARLYETDQPDKAHQCLQQIERISVDEALDAEGLGRAEADEAHLQQLREDLSPQLLNNMACYQFQIEKLDAARELFQNALNACVKYGERDDALDTDALVTTISYNLARTYEESRLLEEAKQVYEGLLARHDDYTDARIRVAYIQLQLNPTEDGPTAISTLNQTDGSNLEVRALLGWYLSKSKKRASNIAEDQEQKHYKKTLIDFDKHDRYSLTGMGNLYSLYAREMRRSTDKEKEKRSNEYLRAIGYFDKVLQLDPRNAYAAQGIGITLIEDKKDLTSAIQIFSKIKETIRDSSVYVNLGHVFCELKQYVRAIENYENALHKGRAHDPQILACLGRVYLLKGKQDKSITAMKTSLQYSRQAFEIAPTQIHFKFNVAFVQIQLAQLLYTLPETQRSLVDVESASLGLDMAIEAFTEIANSKDPPYPKHDLEQRANMGRNTMRRQLERAIAAQREYEAKNSAKLDEARRQREAELKRREEENRQAEEAAAEQRRKVQAERQKMLELSRSLADQRAEEERRREEAEMTTDSETGERIRRKKKTRPTGTVTSKRKKKTANDSDSESDDEARGRQNSGKRDNEDHDDEEGATDDGKGYLDGNAARRSSNSKKRRKLARRSVGGSGKYKSNEMVDDSDSSENGEAASSTLRVNGEHEVLGAEEDAPDTKGTNGSRADDNEEGDVIAARPRKAQRRAVVGEDDDEDASINGDDNEDDLHTRNHAGVNGNTTMRSDKAKTTAEEGLYADLAEEDDADRVDAVADLAAANTFADTDVSMVDEGTAAAGGGREGDVENGLGRG